MGFRGAKIGWVFRVGEVFGGVLACVSGGFGRGGLGMSDDFSMFRWKLLLADWCGCADVVIFDVGECCGFGWIVEAWRSGGGRSL